MVIALKVGEEQKVVAHFHWSNYVRVGTWTVLMTLMGVGLAANGNVAGLFPALIAGWLPLGYRWLQNKCKHYVVTNQRLYIEEGVIAKRKQDVPLNKVNDFQLKQGVLQRLLGAGDIIVLTGNDKPTRIANIDNPEQFKDRLSEVVGSFGKAA